MVMHNIIVCDDRPSPPGGVKLCAAVQLGASPGGPPHGGAGEAGNACVNCTSRTFPACVSIDPEPKAIPALPSRANRLSAWPCSGTRRCLRVQSLGMPQLTLCRRHRRGPAPSVVAVVWCAAPGRKNTSTPSSTRKVVRVVDSYNIYRFMYIYYICLSPAGCLRH